VQKWLEEYISKITDLADTVEAEIELTTASGSKKRADKASLDESEGRLATHKLHIDNLEKVRCLRAGAHRCLRAYAVLVLVLPLVLVRVLVLCHARCSCFGWWTTTRWTWRRWMPSRTALSTTSTATRSPTSWRVCTAVCAR
jgi:hypothetical protein